MGKVVSKIIRILLHPACVCIAAILFFALIRYLDTRWRFLPYTFAVTLVIAAIFFLFSRRPVFSFYGAAAIVLLQTAASIVKFKLKGYSLHVFDFIFTSTDTAILGFLIKYYTPLVVGAVLALAATGAFLWALFRAEKPLNAPVLVRLPALLLAVGVSIGAHPTARPGDPPFIFGFNASSLFMSFWHIPSLIGEPPLAAKLRAVQTQGALADTVECGPEVGRADLYLVLSESHASPMRFPEISFPPEIADTFRSGDGTIKPMFVETFGGGTWMSNFSMLTALSSADFSWQAPYVNQLLEGKIKGALPEMLARCGYRTVAIMPMKYNAVNEGPFLRSIGFQEVYDAADLALPEWGVRDKLYFDFAEKLIAEHRKTDTRPLFLSMETMFAHAPYDKEMVPQALVPAESFADDRKVNEYARRVALARADLQAFLDRRAEEAPERRSVAVDFGDHQSEATLGYALALDPAKNMFADFRSPVYETYFAVRGYGVAIDYAKLDQAEDIAFVMARILNATGLPISPKFRNLNELSEACGGRYHTCNDRGIVDEHLKKLANSGLLDAS
ncbi:sulfatase-like hydrolase/transferase [Rhizobium sp. 21-4511-3d]